jgi:hypothetical protein
MIRALLAAALLAATAVPASAQTASGVGATYQTPPAPIPQILDTPPQPAVALSPDRDTMALLGRANLPSIAELAAPDLKLASYRINPRNNGQANSRVQWLNALSFQAVNGGAERSVALPRGARFTNQVWSPNGEHLAFLVDADTRLDLWVADVRTATARRMNVGAVNAAFPGAISWLPDSSALLVRTVVPAAPPPRRAVPPAHRCRRTPRTARPHLPGPAEAPRDERLFERYFTSQLAVVPLNGAAPPRRPTWADLGFVGVAGRPLPAPDPRQAAPTAMSCPAALFPTEITVTDLNGRVIRRVADLPLRDDVPPPFDAVAPGPRDVQWRADAPSTLVWAEAQDGGDPRRPAPVRDRVFMQDAPFSAAPRVLVDLPERYSNIEWGRPDFALVYSGTYNTRNETRTAVNPSAPGGAGRLLLKRNYQDRYNDPGSPLLRANAQGRRVIHFTPDGQGLFVAAQGSSAEGDFPFLARMALADGRSERLWQARAPYYETPVALLDEAGERS